MSESGDSLFDGSSLEAAVRPHSVLNILVHGIGPVGRQFDPGEEQITYLAERVLPALAAD